MCIYSSYSCCFDRSKRKNTFARYQVRRRKASPLKGVMVEVKLPIGVETSSFSSSSLTSSASTSSPSSSSSSLMLLKDVSAFIYLPKMATQECAVNLPFIEKAFNEDQELIKLPPPGEDQPCRRSSGRLQRESELLPPRINLCHHRLWAFSVVESGWKTLANLLFSWRLLPSWTKDICVGRS